MVLLTALSALALACGDSGGGDWQRPGRVILIGVDGASPRVVSQLIAEGRMPNLAKIAQQGGYGPLLSSLPISSPRIWNTIVTGQVPEKHGILDFAYRDGQGKNHLFSSTDRKARALWSIASEARMTVGVVNFWNTYPLEKVNGVMVSDHLLAKEIQGREQMTGAVKTKSGEVIYPPEWNHRLSRLVTEQDTPIADFPNPFADEKPLPRWVLRDELQRRFAEDGAIARIAEEVANESQPDVMMVLLPGVDRIQHYLWGVLESPDTYTPGLQPTPEGREGGKQAIHSYYEYVDQLIGALTAGYGEDDLVMVLSDHGFEAGEAMLRLSGVHESHEAIHGILYVKGPGIEPGTSIKQASVADITPTILTWLGLPTALDMDGKLGAYMHVAARPPIETYDHLPLEFIDPDEVPSGVEDDIVEHLKSLGYIDEE